MSLVLVGSRGAFPEHYARRVELELSYADVPTARQADPVTLGLLTVYLVKKYGWVTLQDVAKEFVWGALAGEGDSLAAISGDLALGALPFLGIFADGRDLVKEVCRLWPGGDDPNVGVVGFAILGLVTELPFFKAVGVDAVIGLAKVVMKQLDPALPLAKATWLYFKSALTELSVPAIERVGPLLDALWHSITNPADTFRQAAEAGVRSQEGFTALAVFLKRFPDGDDVYKRLIAERAPQGRCGEGTGSDGKDSPRRGDRATSTGQGGTHHTCDS